jgi:outer membrane protein insertion porin family
MNRPLHNTNTVRRQIGYSDVGNVTLPLRFTAIAILATTWTVQIGCQSMTDIPDASYQSNRWLHQGDQAIKTAALSPDELRRSSPSSVQLASYQEPVVRAQDTPTNAWDGGRGPTGAPRGPMPAGGTPTQPPSTTPYAAPANSGGPRVAQTPVESGYPAMQPPGEWTGAPQDINPTSPFFGSPFLGNTENPLNLPPNFADIDAIVQEGQTGRFMIGAGINSDAGLTGQLIYDEKNFDITALPRSWRDVTEGYAFRGGAQTLRIEAYPGNVLQRYMVSFSDPYFRGTPVSFGVSGYYFDRNYYDWDEQRLGGRLSMGYRLTPDIALTGATRIENVKIMDPRVDTSAELNAALGSSELYIGQLSLTQDTRDNPFAATEGYFLELSYQQAFGTYDYPRGDLRYNRYFLLRERPDGSGRHTLMYSTQLGITGSQTPIYENYFAGGFSTIRGFDFRGASPMQGGVRVGGEFMWINTVEYMFPLTADDMLKGVVFCDFGTVEEKVEINGEDMRVAPGFGFRVQIPRMGNGAPLAFDFAFPVLQESTDDERVFSFFMGFLR